MDKDHIQIVLEVSKALSTLSGRSNGEKIYEVKIEPQIKETLNNPNMKYVIKIPENINLVSGSFLLGMFEKIVRLLGITGIIERFFFDQNTSEDCKTVLLNEIKRSGIE